MKTKNAVRKTSFLNIFIRKNLEMFARFNFILSRLKFSISSCSWRILFSNLKICKCTDKNNIGMQKKKSGRIE